MRALIAGITALCAAVTPAAAQSILLDEEIEGVLRDYTDPILVAANLRPEDVHMYLVQESSINAFVTGGQNIFVHSGTLMEADSPNQIKGVLAHEVGHMAGGHLRRADKAQNAAIGTMLATMALGLGAAMAGAPDAGAAVMAGSQQLGYATFARHTLVQEAAADQAAASYMDATGQSTRGLAEFFEKLRSFEVLRDRESGSMYGDFLRDHPSSSTRVSALRQRMENSPFTDVKDSPEDLHKLEMIQAKLTGFIEAPNRVLIIYPESDQSEPARYARAVAHFRNGVLSRALEEIDSLIAEEPDNPFFRELHGQMLFESGKAAEAVAPYREAVRLMPESGLLRLGLAQAMIATNDEALQPEAIEELKASIHLRPDLPMAWRQLSIAYERSGERDLAQLAVAEQSYAQGDYIRAWEFARRAQEGLEHGGPNWRRATDILAVSETLAREQAERERRRLSWN